MDAPKAEEEMQRWRQYYIVKKRKQLSSVFFECFSTQLH